MLLQIEYDPRRVIYQESGYLVLNVPDEGGKGTVAATLTTRTYWPLTDEARRLEGRYAQIRSVRSVHVTVARGSVALGREQAVREKSSKHYG